MVKIKYLFFILLIYNQTLEAQSQIVTLEEAVQIALKNDPSIIRDQLEFHHQEKLQGSGAATPNTQIFLSGDEFDFGGMSGVQSLNAQQNFNLPKVSKTYNKYYQAQTVKAERQLNLTKKEVRKNVEQAYYELVFAKRKLKLLDESQNIYNAFLARTKALLNSGETGLIPVSSAGILRQEAQMTLNHAAHEVGVAREILNIWLGDVAKYDINDSDLIMVKSANLTTEITSAYLDILKAEKEIAEQNINIQKVKLLPQINTGVRVQSVNGDILFFGYQAGVNVPLFRKSQTKKLQAAKIEIEKQDAAILAEEKLIRLKVTKIKNHIAHIKEKVAELENQLIPAVERQQKLLEEAYMAGEGNYFEYVIVLKNYSELKLMRLNLIEDYFLNMAEYSFWTNE